MNRDALERWIAGQLPACSHDELRVISWIVEGLVVGRRVYGPLDVHKDPRNFRQERAEEARDSLFYAACQVIAERDADRERIEIEFDEALSHEIGAKP